MTTVVNHVHKAYNITMKIVNCIQCGQETVQKTSRPKRFCSRKCEQADFYFKHPEKAQAYWKKYYNSKPQWHVQRARAYEEKRGYEWVRAVNSKATRNYKEKTRHGGHKEYLMQKFGGCEECKTTKALQIHHIDRVSFHNSTEPNNDLDNLRLLCQTCHLKLHHKKGWKKEL